MTTAKKPHTSYNQEEDELLKRIYTCNQATESMLQMMEEEPAAIHSLTLEDILLHIHTMKQDLQTELLHLLLEKAIHSEQRAQADELPSPEDPSTETGS
ncbi:hypothetical protein [Marinicrinis sediminis]|uniref:Spore coat protein n=1 Tax=Marinicrinis sediminis TaxID=1652465 RepID=A0ABW5RAZ3_9BACL